MNEYKKDIHKIDSHLAVQNLVTNHGNWSHFTIDSHTEPALYLMLLEEVRQASRGFFWAATEQRLVD